MANELKIAKAAREIARELGELPPESPYPFGCMRVFLSENKAPCCVIGHVIERAGLSGLAKGRPSGYRVSYVSSTAALRDVFGVDELHSVVAYAVDDVVGANDLRDGAAAVSENLYTLADVLELSTAPQEA